MFQQRPIVNVPPALHVMWGGALAVLLGCGGAPTGTYSVTGTVHYQGKPLADACIQFIPSMGRPAAGQTQADGQFQLLTWRPEDGALAGEHVVCISKSVADPQDASPYPQMTSILPERYSTPTQSPLRALVQPGQSNDFHFELTE